MGRLLCVIGNGDALGQTYRRLWRFCHYRRYDMRLRSVERTVGFCVFPITHGMKWGWTRLNIPWVLAFLPLPTVEMGLDSAKRTVGFGVFAITHGMRWGLARPNVPWVFAFFQLPTV